MYYNKNNEKIWHIVLKKKIGKNFEKKLDKNLKKNVEYIYCWDEVY